MYWTHILRRTDFVDGTVFVHNISRINMPPSDARMFVDPPDAAIMCSFRALEPDQSFAESFVASVAFMRRRNDCEAIVEALHPVFTQIEDHASLERLIRDLMAHARSLGYVKLCFARSVLRPQVQAALGSISKELERYVELRPSNLAISLD